MNKENFLEVLLPTGEYYSKTITDGLICVYYEQVKDLDAQTFEALIKAHIADTDQGRFWPTFAHLVAQAGTEDDAGIQAGIDFDKNTGVDGTGTFDRRNETVMRTAQRRKKYIDGQKLGWKQLAVEEKIQNPILLGSTLRIEG